MLAQAPMAPERLIFRAHAERGHEAGFYRRFVTDQRDGNLRKATTLTSPIS